MMMITPKKTFLVLFSLIGIYFIKASEASVVADSLVNEIEIWPGVGPGSDTLSIEEFIIVRSLSGTCTRNWAIDKITVPTITPVLPDNPNGSAVIICPGGAYQRVVYDVEGLDIAKWLNSIGITAFVLKYRLPMDPHIDKKNVPLQDAQRALRYVRANAGLWGIDTTKIGIMGASAGGHMASTLATSYNKKVYTQKDFIDSVSAHPNFMLLLYPVVSMASGTTHATTRDMLLGTSPDQATIDEFSAEKNVTNDFPITFMARAADDNGVSAENCNRLYAALQDSGIVSQLKIFENGGHGVGICKAGGSDFENWPDYCTNWLHENGLTEDSVIIVEEGPEPVGVYDMNENQNEHQVRVFPNPVNKKTNVYFSVPENGNIKIAVFDINGKSIATVVNEYKTRGNYIVSLDNIDQHLNGVYFIQLQSNKAVITEKVYY